MAITQLFREPRLKKKAFTYNVTTPAANRPLDLTTVKNYLKISGSSEDDFLNLLIDAATSFGEKYTNRDFINKTYTTYRDSFNDCLELRRSRISSISSVKYLINSVLTTVSTTVYGFTDVNDYSELFLKEDQEWPSDTDNIPQAVEIIFVAGYGATEASVPAELKMAMLGHIAFLYSNRGDCSACDSGDASSLPGSVKAMYDRFRLINIGSCK